MSRDAAGPSSISTQQRTMETERLLLRRFTEADASLLVDLDGDPEVMRYLNGGVPTPRETIERRILPLMLKESGSAGFGFWALIERTTGNFVGWASFRPRPEAGEAELGYRVKRSSWGNGYATEAARAIVGLGFREFGVKRVFATTYEDNFASRRVMDKLGMKLVRRFRYSPTGAGHPGTYTSDPAEVWEGQDVEYALTWEQWRQCHAS